MEQGTAPISDLWPIAFQCDDDDVPAFAVMAGTGATTNHGELVVTVKQYGDADVGEPSYINGPVDVATGRYGRCTTAALRPVMALGSSELSAGDVVGQTDGEWELSAGGSGFVVVGASPVAGTVMVLRDSGETVVGFVLTEDMNETTQGEASCTMQGTWDAATESYTGSESGGVVVDNSDPQIFSEALSGASGKGWLRAGNERQVIDPIVISC